MPEMYNESSRCMIEKWDVNCTDYPQVCGAALALQREYEFQAAACMDEFMLKTDRKVTKMMLKGYEKDKAANAPKPKYRCLVWACPRIITPTSPIGLSTAGASPV